MPGNSCLHSHIPSTKTHVITHHSITSASTNVSAFLQTERINTGLCIRKERVANEMVAHNVAW